MKKDVLAISCIATLIGIFFFRLFWPEPQLIVTPDFGRSDAWHFSFATKFALAQSLKQGKLPLWEPRMGGGFPLFAEGQVGALFLPNLLLFKFIEDPVIAYNLSYVLIFLTLGWGMYLWLRIIGCRPLASLFGAVTIIFSGQTIPRLPHHTLLQALSLYPLVAALAHLVITKKHVAWISTFALLVSQQIFTGFPQMVLLSLATVALYALVMLWGKKIAALWPPIGRLIIGCVLGIGIAAIQLLPSAEMLSQSTHPSGFSPGEASYYSFPLVHLKTLIDPFILGNPRFGTYPPFTAFDGSIFWENNLYISILPIVLFILGFMRKSRIVIFFATALLASFLLMLGKHSPLYLLYSMWPLNLFRVPSRFAWIFLFTIVTAASWSLRWKKILTIPVIILITLHTYQLMSTWWDYHAIESASQRLSATPFIDSIKKTQGPVVRTIGSELVHNEQFLTHGWEGNLDYYRHIRNAPAPNSNLYWNIRQSDVYAGRFLKRPSLVESLLGAEIKISDTVATISAQGKRLLDLYHAAIIVSAVPLDMEKSFPVLATTTSANITITAYRNPEATPRAYLATQTVVAPTLTKTADVLANPAFTPGSSVIVHDQSLSLQPSDSGGGGTVEITSEKPTRVTMHVDVEAFQVILVFGDTYYPGWQATIDGKPAKIFPVNIKERGMLVPKGSHEVIWQYRPKSVAVGGWVSGIATTVALLLLFFSGRHVSGKQE